MKRVITILAILSLFSIEGKAQCPTTAIVLNSQTKIDSFSIHYPNCYDIKGELLITGNIANLDSLIHLKSVATLIVSNSSNLKSLKGLEELNEIGVFKISDNADLQTIEKLDKLTKIQKELLITNNENLISIYDFYGLKQLKNITISNNPKLLEINAFTWVKDTINTISISNNHQLERLFGFDYVSVIAKSFTVSNCENLTDINAFGSMQQILGRMVFSNIKTDPMPNLSKVSYCSYLLLDQINAPQILFDEKKMFYNEKYLDDTLLITNCSIQKIVGYYSQEGFITFRFDYVSIINNPNLDSIFTFLGINRGLTIENNSNLKKVDGLAMYFRGTTKIDERVRYLKINNNPKLYDFSKLYITSAIIDFIDTLEISGNNALQVATFLTGIRVLKNGNISNNALLENISFGGATFTMDGQLTIENNANLKNINFLNIINCEQTQLAVTNNKALASINFPPTLLKVFNSLTLIDNISLNPIELKATSITNLTLQNNGTWTSINGFNLTKDITTLIIKDNKELTTINGFQLLETIYNLTLEQNPVLQSIAGFKNVNKIREGGLNIINNDKLLNLNDLTLLKRVYGSINILSNKNLQSLFNEKNQIEFLRGNIKIEDNKVLTNLIGLEGLDLNQIQTRISRNTQLTYCNYSNICSALKFKADIIIDGNNANCGNNQEVLDLCNGKSNQNVYPNPAHDQLNLKIHDIDYMKFITIYDMQGRLIHYFDTIQNTIDISGLTNGIYYLEVASDKLNFKQKFVKY